MTTTWDPALPFSPCPQLIATQLFSVPSKLFWVICLTREHRSAYLAVLGASSLAQQLSQSQLGRTSAAGQWSLLCPHPEPFQNPTRSRPASARIMWLYSHRVMDALSAIFAELETPSCIEGVQWIRYNNIHSSIFGWRTTLSEAITVLKLFQLYIQKKKKIQFKLEIYKAQVTIWKYLRVILPENLNLD